MSTIPFKNDVEQWSVEQLAAYLQQTELADCVQSVLGRSIDGRKLLNLSQSHVLMWTEIPLKLRRKLFKFINEINSLHTTTSQERHRGELDHPRHHPSRNGGEAHISSLITRNNKVSPIEADSGSDSWFSASDEEDGGIKKTPVFIPDGGNSGGFSNRVPRTRKDLMDGFNRPGRSPPPPRRPPPSVPLTPAPPPPEPLEQDGYMVPIHISTPPQCSKPAPDVPLYEAIENIIPSTSMMNMSLQGGGVMSNSEAFTMGVGMPMSGGPPVLPPRNQPTPRAEGSTDRSIGGPTLGKTKSRLRGVRGGGGGEGASSTSSPAPLSTGGAPPPPPPVFKLRDSKKDHHQAWTAKVEPRPSSTTDSIASSQSSSSSGRSRLSTASFDHHHQQQPSVHRLPLPPTPAPRYTSDDCVTLSDGEKVALTPLYRSLLQKEYFFFATRNDAIELLTKEQDDGVFLIRPSTKHLTLSLLFDGQVKNIPIRQRSSDKCFALGSQNKKVFVTVDDLVEYYKEYRVDLTTGGHVLLSHTPGGELAEVYVKIPMGRGSSH